MLNNLLLIALGGAIGSVCRYLLSYHVQTLFSRMFPYGTLSVNLIGSFLMGFLFVILLNRLSYYSEQLRSLLLIGFLGGFTTFSSFSIETLNLFEDGEIMTGFLNILFSCILCISAAWIGVLLGRSV